MIFGRSFPTTTARAESETRKDFALAVQSKCRPEARAVAFRCYDGADVRPVVIERLLGFLGSASRLEEAKKLVAVNW